MNDPMTGLAADDKIRDIQQAGIKRARERRAEAYRLKKSGLKYREVAEKLGVSWQRAQTLVHRHIKETQRKSKNGG